MLKFINLSKTKILWKHQWGESYINFVEMLITIVKGQSHQFWSGIRDSKKTGSLWGMMRCVGGVRKSIHQSLLAKGLGLGLLVLIFTKLFAFYKALIFLRWVSIQLFSHQLGWRRKNNFPYMVHGHVEGAFNKFPDFFVQAFKIVVDY